MAINVKFLKGTSAEYNSSSKNPNTFYYTSDDSQLYLGVIKLSNADDLRTAVTRIAQNEKDIDALERRLQELVGDGTDSIAEMIAAAINPVKASVGSLSELGTTAKDSLVNAINELKNKNDEVKQEGTVSVDTSTSGLTQGVAARYIVKQGSNIVGVIDIPKDMVVSDGRVVQNPAGEAAGTYIELTLANAKRDKIYINVGTLVDIYTAKINATEIQMVVDSDTREISATIVNGAVTASKLATNAVTTGKIADANVTKAKLATDVQASLGKADSAVQKIITGTTLGTIKVDGTDVKVAGLGTAAYLSADQITAATNAVQEALDEYKSTNDTKVNANTAAIAAINNSTTGILKQAKDYADTKDAATKTAAVTEAKAYADGLAGNYATKAQGAKADTAVQKADVVEGTTNGAILVQDKIVKVHGLGTAAYQEVGAFDAAGSAAAAKTAAVTEAKAYIDSALTWETIA